MEQETALCQKTLVLSSFLKMCSCIISTFKINQTNKSITLLEGFDLEIVPMSDLTDLYTLYRVTNLLLLSSFGPMIPQEGKCFQHIR